MSLLSVLSLAPIALAEEEADWLVDGNTRAFGVGMEVEDGLAVGWRRVAD